MTSVKVSTSVYEQRIVKEIIRKQLKTDLQTERFRLKFNRKSNFSPKLHGIFGFFALLISTEFETGA